MPFTVQAVTCPDGSQPVNGSCHFQFGGANQDILNKLAEEGGNGPTSEQAERYMNKVLGSNVMNKIKALDSQENEDTDGWLQRMLNKMTGKDKCIATDTANTLAGEPPVPNSTLQQIWEDLFGVLDCPPPSAYQ